MENKQLPTENELQQQNNLQTEKELLTPNELQQQNRLQPDSELQQQNNLQTEKELPAPNELQQQKEQQNNPQPECMQQNKLDCAIVRDLLPSYVDGLTSAATNEAVNGHLAQCAACTEALQQMQEPEPELKLEPAAGQATEVDYLKKVRRRSKSRGLAIGIVLALIALSLLSFRIFYVGTQAEPADINYHVAVDGNTLNLSGNLQSSTSGVARVLFEESAGIINVKVYTAPKTFFNSNSFSEQYAAASDAVGLVRCADLIIWEGGVEIGNTASQLYAALNPFLGDMPAASRLAGILGIADQLGSFTSELQTAKEPYGWTLLLDNQIAAAEESAAQAIMTADAYVLLATIDNLGYVTWQYTTAAGQQEYTVAADDASAFAGGDIKQCAASASALQNLLQSLSLKWSGVRGTLQDDGRFLINVRNNSTVPIYGLQIDYYLDGKLIGSGASVNADNSKIAEGDSLQFTFTPEDLPEGTSTIQLADFSFDLAVLDADGQETAVAEGVKIAARYGWNFSYELSGNYADGFALNEQ